MKFTINRKLSENVFSTKITFKEYGDDSLSAQDEQNLIEDFGPAILEVGGEYKGNFKLQEKELAKVEEKGEDSDEISFVMNNEKYQLKEGFSIDFSVDALKNIPKEIDKFKQLKTPYQIAEAKCILFEEEIKSRVIKILKKFKDNKTSFESKEQEFTA